MDAGRARRGAAADVRGRRRVTSGPALSAGPAPYSTRRLGGVDITVFAVADASNWTVTFADGRPLVADPASEGGAGPVDLPINGMAIRSADRVVLVDAGEWAEPVEVPGGISVVPSGALESTLGELGIRPDDVTHVVVTHLHLDHVKGLSTASGAPRFRNAQHFLPAKDWAAYVVEDGRGNAAELRRELDAVERAGLLVFVDGDRELADDLCLLQTPGESPGHQVVRLETGERTVYYLGDLVHWAVEFEELELTLPGRDVALMAASRERIFREAVARDGLVVYTHANFPGWGVVEATSASSWRWSPDPVAPARAPGTGRPTT
jgi:glyoxylase-like metal-dependent hydrolase (beta-lactamase superfamily II)